MKVKNAYNVNIKTTTDRKVSFGSPGESPVKVSNSFDEYIIIADSVSEASKKAEKFIEELMNDCASNLKNGERDVITTSIDIVSISIMTEKAIEEN